MHGQTNSSIFFSSNAVVGGDGAMARRKGMMTARVAMIVCVVLLVGVLMGGRIFLTNQITGLRTRVADLANQKEFLEAESAQLHLRWNHASSGKVIVARAQKELGLIVPQEPGLVLVCVEEPKKIRGVWRKFWKGLPVKGEAGEMVVEAMVSLVPRGARAAGVEGRVE